MYSEEELEKIKKITDSFLDVFNIIDKEEEFWMKKDENKKNKEREDDILRLMDIRRSRGVLKMCLERQNMISFIKIIVLSEDDYYRENIKDYIFIKFRGVNNEKTIKEKEKKLLNALSNFNHSCLNLINLDSFGKKLDASNKKVDA